ncbi:MAG: L-fucose isomerase [Clostridiales bacterium]|nr:L-fucose isomerase [Clostridiales bacterium]
MGIRPIIDGRWGGVRESLEKQTMDMAAAAKRLLQESVFYSDGSPADVVIADGTIGGGAEAARCAEKFLKENVCATLSVTPCWCYGSETMDLDPLTVKAVWGFNGTERPGAVYLAAVMAAHAQRGLPAFAIYGRDVRDMTDGGITPDVREKIIRFGQCALAVGQMRNKAYVGIGGVSMGIAGSFADPLFMQKYFGVRTEWADMTEISRRVDLGIYDKKEYEKALAWVKKNCPQSEKDGNAEKLTAGEYAAQWEFTVKMTLVIRDVMLGNPELAKMGFHEEALGRNAVLGGFQGQRQWTDYKPNADFAEAILSSSFDWNGKREQILLATENDNLNGFSMLFGKLLTGSSPVFADVRTYWSPESVERATGWKPDGKAAGGFIHLINSGAAALDGTGASRDSEGLPVMKKWADVTDKDIAAMLKATEWAPANRQYFRGGGFSSRFLTRAEMPVTLIRLNWVEGIGPALQFAEGWTVALPDEVSDILWKRTDYTWPCTWFAPRLNHRCKCDCGDGCVCQTAGSNPAFDDVYSVMANWGANHGAFVYGHIGKELITLSSMLRIPVSLHNAADKDVFRPHSFAAFGTKNLESADFAACKAYGPLYK